MIQHAKKISIHALLAESDTTDMRQRLIEFRFLSTLSLRRATTVPGGGHITNTNFYPRSPCGERLHYDNYNLHCVEISIHALLAESDFFNTMQIVIIVIFLSTLSLRRATLNRPPPLTSWAISIHALLAESDIISPHSAPDNGDFYPRSPCGERPASSQSSAKSTPISIHALLAESDACVGMYLQCRC